jgi:hypothetical protein
MPSASDFRTIQIQASIFTPGLQFRSAKVLTHLLSEHGDKFDGDPSIAPSPIGLPKLPIQIHFGPQFSLQSRDGMLKLMVRSERLDLVQERDEGLSEDQLGDFLNWACKLVLGYLKFNDAKAGRLACVQNRICEDQNPSLTLAKHFCKDELIAGPLNRPGEFELHAHKRFRLGTMFDINSWMRFRTAVKQGQLDFPPTAILVEQDFNTLSEQMESREICAQDITGFFELAPREMRSVLEKYFPPGRP